MKNKIASRIVLAVMLVIGFVNFSPAHAVNCGDSSLSPDSQTNLCLPASSNINSPSSVNTLLIDVINILLSVAALIAVLFIVIGGFMYITSAGNSEQAEKGRTTLVNAIIGLIIIILAYVIVSVVN